MNKRTVFSALFPFAIAVGGCGVKDRNAVSLPASTATVKAPEPVPDAAADPPPGADASGAVPYSGTVEAHRRSTLSPKISGVVARVHVREGDRVRKGDLLVSFDQRDVGLRLRQARAALEAAEVQRDAALDEWRRVKILAGSAAVPQAQLDGVEFKKRGAEIAVESARVAVEMSRKAVSDSVVRAPYDGLIVRRLVNEGDYATTMPPTALVVVEETGIVDVRIQTPSSEMGKIRVGDPVTVTFPSLGRSIEATVTRVVASVDARTRAFSVIIELPNADGQLLPGLFAEARFARPSTVEARP